MKNNFKYAFTLVELIVVITILSVLSVIAYISISGYVESAKHSTRLSDIQSIKKQLSLKMTVKGQLPNPDNALNLKIGSNSFISDGVIGNKMKNELGVHGELKDPFSKAEYRYVTQGRNYSIFTNSNNSEYSYEFATMNNIPKAVNTITNQDLFLEQQGEIDILTDPNFISGTYAFALGESIRFDKYRMVDNIVVLEGIDSSIDFSTDDVCNQTIYFTNGKNSATWLGCNMGASEVYKLPEEIVGWDDYYFFPSNSNDSYTDFRVDTNVSPHVRTTELMFGTGSAGKLYPWGSNSGFFYMDSLDFVGNDTDGNNSNDLKIDLSLTENSSYRSNCEIGNNNVNYIFTQSDDYCIIPNDNLWSDTNASGICPDGYHVPNKYDWNSSITTIVGDSNDISGTLQGQQRGIKMKKVLRLPFNGTYIYRFGRPTWIGNHGSYWSTEVDGDNAKIFGFDGGGNFYPINLDARTKTGMAGIRCIRN